jgi:DNA-binding Lrp family transcriptional regulator
MASPRPLPKWNRTTGTTLKIITILDDYGKPLPQSFLANLMNFNDEEMEKRLNQLEDEGVVKLEGGNVELT